MGAAYESIKLDLRKKILGKTWLTGIKIPSSRDLAAVYNCSTNTIEKSLKELQREGLLVREPRRGTFVAEQLFPAEADSARVAEEGRVVYDAIATVVDDVNSYIFSKAFRGIEDTLATRGIGLTISSHDNDPRRQESILGELVAKGVRGIILYPALSFENDLYYYRRIETLLEKAKVVCMDRHIYNSHLSIPYVTSDNFYASYQLTQRLIENGHRRIGFVRNYNVSTVLERRMGFQQALHDYGIPYKDDMDIRLQATNEALQDFPTDWLAEKIEGLRLTALFATNYNLAGHLMGGLAKLGLGIPRDISLVSYEVEYMNGFMPMKITGITQCFYEMGRTAAKIMLNLLDNTHESDVSGFLCRSIINPGETIRNIG